MTETYLQRNESPNTSEFRVLLLRRRWHWHVCLDSILPTNPVMTKSRVQVDMKCKGKSEPRRVAASKYRSESNTFLYETHPGWDDNHALQAEAYKRVSVSNLTKYINESLSFHPRPRKDRALVQAGSVTNAFTTSYIEPTPIAEICFPLSFASSPQSSNFNTT